MLNHKQKRNRPATSSRSTSATQDRDPVPERERRVHHRTEPGRERLFRSLEQTRTMGRTSVPGARANSAFFAFSRPLISFLIAGLMLGVFRFLLPNSGAGPVVQNTTTVPQSLAGPPALSLARLMTPLAIVLCLVFLNAFFAIAEIALITVRRTRIRQLVEEGNRNAKRIELLLQHPTRLMATIQTGETLIATFTVAITVATVYMPLVLNHRQSFSQSVSSALLFGVTLPVAVLLLVIGQIAPKSLAAGHSERLALLAAQPVWGLQLLLTPVVAILTFLSNLIVKPFGGTVSFTVPAVNEEELKMLVEASEEQGVLEAEETEMINSILSFGDMVVRKVMTPRIDITAVDVETTLLEMIRVINESGHSRIPVYEENLDDIVGIVHAKDLLGLSLEVERSPSSPSLRRVMRAPYFIPETKKGDELLTEFRRSKQQIAIVRDEYGLTAGLVTIEDLLEEIVGDIRDEYDATEEPQVQVVEGATILDGKMSLSDVNDRMGLDLPEDEADTIGGFVFNLLGHQAEQGETAAWDGYFFCVEATDGRRIVKVRLSRATSHAEPLSALPSDHPDATDAADREQIEVGR